MPKSSYQLNQVILYIQDMDREVRFYRDLLGLPILYPSGKADYASEMWVEFEAGGSTLALHGGLSHPVGIDHEFVFFVEDIETAWGELNDANVDIGEIRILETGEPIASGTDPEGHRFSIRATKKE